MKREIEKEDPESKLDLEASIRRVAGHPSIPQRFDDCINVDGEVIPYGLRSP